MENLERFLFYFYGVMYGTLFFGYVQRTQAKSKAHVDSYTNPKTDCGLLHSASSGCLLFVVVIIVVSPTPLETFCRLCSHLELKLEEAGTRGWKGAYITL